MTWLASHKDHLGNLKQMQVRRKCAEEESFHLGAQGLGVAVAHLSGVEQDLRQSCLYPGGRCTSHLYCFVAFVPTKLSYEL